MPLLRRDLPQPATIQHAGIGDHPLLTGGIAHIGVLGEDLASFGLAQGGRGFREEPAGAGRDRLAVAEARRLDIEGGQPPE